MNEWEAIGEASVNEFGEPVPEVMKAIVEKFAPEEDRYGRLGAQGKEEGLYVRFDPGFGLNIYIGHRKADYKEHSWLLSSYSDGDEIGMSIIGWEHLCSLVDEWRERNDRRG